MASRNSAEAASVGQVVMLELPKVLAGLPPAPGPELDPVLDAAVRCFARFGYRRTSVQDVAQELGVNRTTVYRQVGNIEQVARLVAARDLHRFVSVLPTLLAGQAAPEALVEGMVAVISGVRAHPVAAKLLADEPELVGSAVAQYVPEFFAQAAGMLAPLLRAGMKAGQLAQRDPVAVAEWLLRVGVSLVLVEPPGDLRAFLSELVVPALTPEPPG
ncbi:MAG: TetR/AcrR family transcriptional regulator, partial [Acidimicrobiales bacterium]